MDRISELPPYIIHHIMSYLSSKEVEKTSILSHQWKYFRASFPIFDFDQRYFVNVGTREFIKFVDDSLNRFFELKFCPQKIRLFITYLDKKMFSSFDKWIGLAIENEVKEFYIKFSFYKAKRVPQTIFFAKSLTALKLVCCKLDLPSFTIRLYSLKKLTLNDVYIEEEMLQKLISECPLLEDLALCYCINLKNFRVTKAFKLKIITFKLPFPMQIESAEISVLPSLQELTLQFNTSRPMPQVVDIFRCPQLETLTFSDVNLRILEFNHFISKFLFLENLSVNGCDLLERIKISSKRLKNLKFLWCDDVREIDVDAPNLLSLKFSCCHNLREIHVDTPNLLSFTCNRNPITTASINAPCPWEVYFEVDEGDLDTRWLINLKDFLGQSKQIKRLPVALKCKKVSFNLDELRESFPPFPFQVGILEFSIMNVPSSEFEALLNGFFSICYPKILSVSMYLKGETKFCYWLYEELRNRDVNCCNSRHIKCWRHHFKVLKDLKVNFTGAKLDDINLMDGFPILHGGNLQFFIH